MTTKIKANWPQAKDFTEFKAYNHAWWEEYRRVNEGRIGAMASNGQFDEIPFANWAAVHGENSFKESDFKL